MSNAFEDEEFPEDDEEAQLDLQASGNQFDDDDDDDCDMLMQTMNGARNDDESGLHSPQPMSLSRHCPPQETIPVGATVTVVDSRIRLEEMQAEHWEEYPMATIIGCTGQVIRHTGDFSLVQFFTDEERIQTTIFRGALSIFDDEFNPNQDNDIHLPQQSTLMPDVLSGTMAGDNLQITMSISNPDSLEEDEESALALFEAANQLFSKKQYQDAITAFSAILATSHAARIGTHAVLSNRSGAYLAIGDTSSAFEDAQMAINLKPTSTKGYVRAGNVHRSLHQYQQAKRQFASALKIDPKNAEIQYYFKYSQLAEVYQKNLNLRGLHVTWTRQNRVNIRCRKGIDIHAKLFSENPLFVVGVLSSSGLGNQGPKCCDFCCRTLVVPEVIEGAPESLKRSLESFLREHTIVSCEGDGCRAQYCSENCRSRALISFHSLECAGSTTRWAKVVHKEFSSPPSEGCTIDSAECSLLHLAVRIAGTAIARVRAERPSNFDKFFLDLFPAGTSSSLISPALRQVSDDLFQQMQGSMSSEEKTIITRDQWNRILQVVVTNGKFCECTPWTEYRRSVGYDSEGMKEFMESPEALCCRSHAVALFPTLPHLVREPQGNVKVYHNGSWAPTVHGLTTRPIRAGETIGIVEEEGTYEGETLLPLPTMNSMTL